MKEPTYKLWLASGVCLCCLATTSLSQAQVVSDRTVSTKVTTSDNLNFTITGGSRAGSNLFHSFSEFSAPDKGLALFNNASDVQNIISRVTGNSISNIDGLIRARGGTNLFLLNPNGIIFGPDAQLDIGGSFVASTANRLNFADERFFSATDSQTRPLLSVSVPSGLQFRETAGSIVNRSQAAKSVVSPFGIVEVPIGLEVQPGRTLALIGDGVFLESGRMLAPGGRIELGSLASPDLVSLTPIAAGWTLGYKNVRNFQDIQLSQAFVNTSTNTGGGVRLGDIQLRGKQIAITDGSQVGGANLGAEPGGTLAVKASESVEVSRGSSLNTTTFSGGAAGDITIETRQLVVGEDSFVDTASNSDGQGGNLIVDASESVEVNGNGGLSKLSTQAFEDGDAGTLQVTTGRLILRDGGRLSSSTRNAGDGGSVLVDATESVEASGQGKTASGEVEKSGLFAESEGAGVAGDLTISTRDLVVRDGAAVSVSSQGLEMAGSLEVVARSILLDNQGALTAETMTSGMGGDIRLQAQDIQLQRESSISTTASTGGGPGDGGNITINTDTLVGLENSDITANAFEGRGGLIQITSQGIFGLEVREELTENNDITAFSQEDPSLNGVVEINTPDVDPSKGVVALPEQVVDVGGLVAQNCPAGGGALARGLSEFVATGRGGLPPTPKEALKSDTVLVDLGTPMISAAKPSPAFAESSGQAALEEPPRLAKSYTENYAKSASSDLTHSTATPIVEAQGWVRGSSGQVVLTAQAPTVAPRHSGLTAAACHGF